MFENKKTKSEGVHYSRYIMSWIREGGSRTNRRAFECWLDSLGNLTEDEIYEIGEMFGNGRFELERSVAHFLKK